MPRDQLELTFAGLPASERPHLSVDGMTPAGPNLSHWPGNRTPPRFKADLSTGICLRFARAGEDERAEFLDGAEAVLNDHYDTDGFLSLLAVLRPELAFEREEVCLAAAATGDFQTFQTRRAFAVDRIVAGIADPERSPLAPEFAGLAGPEKALARYRWLLDHAELVLDRPGELAALYEDELGRPPAELDACQQGALERELHPGLGLSVARTRGPLSRTALNTLAGGYRVLHVVESAEGPTVRYHDRTESWFEVVTFAPPPRRDLRPLAARLQELEPTGADGAMWCADPPADPVPELYRGLPAAQAYAEVTRELRPTSLPVDAVVDAVLAHFAEPGC